MEEVKTAILFCNDTLVNFIVKKMAIRKNTPCHKKGPYFAFSVCCCN